METKDRYFHMLQNIWHDIYAVLTNHFAHDKRIETFSCMVYWFRASSECRILETQEKKKCGKIMPWHLKSYVLRKHRKLCLDGVDKKHMNLMSDTKETFHEAQPLGKIPMKQVIPYEFHRNCRNPIICSKGVLIGNFPIGLQSFI